MSERPSFKARMADAAIEAQQRFDKSGLFEFLKAHGMSSKVAKELRDSWFFSTEWFHQAFPEYPLLVRVKHFRKPLAFRQALKNHKKLEVWDVLLDAQQEAIMLGAVGTCVVFNIPDFSKWVLCDWTEESPLHTFSCGGPLVTVGKNEAFLQLLKTFGATMSEDVPMGASLFGETLATYEKRYIAGLIGKDGLPI